VPSPNAADLIYRCFSHPKMGEMLIAGDGETVMALTMVQNSRDETRQDVAKRLKCERAAWQASSSAYEKEIQAITDYVNGHRTAWELPVHLESGTRFQQSVWRALMRIPYGETRSYAEVAEMVGRPRAARAVAQACANNPIFLYIPCHRVVQSDGGLGGYGHGYAMVDKKRYLLEMERQQPAGLLAA